MVSKEPDPYEQPEQPTKRKYSLYLADSPAPEYDAADDVDPSLLLQLDFSKIRRDFLRIMCIQRTCRFFTEKWKDEWKYRFGSGLDSILDEITKPRTAVDPDKLVFLDNLGGYEKGEMALVTEQARMLKTMQRYARESRLTRVGRLELARLLARNHFAPLNLAERSLQAMASAENFHTILRAKGYPAFSALHIIRLKRALTAINFDSSHGRAEMVKAFSPFVRLLGSSARQKIFKSFYVIDFPGETEVKTDGFKLETVIRHHDYTSYLLAQMYYLQPEKIEFVHGIGFVIKWGEDLSWMD